MSPSSLLRPVLQQKQFCYTTGTLTQNSASALMGHSTEGSGPSSVSF